MYDGCTRNAYHLYMFRYDKEKFAGLPRAKFLKALAAEGIPCSGGYSPLNKEPFLKTRSSIQGLPETLPEAGSGRVGQIVTPARRTTDSAKKPSGSRRTC